METIRNIALCNRCVCRSYVRPDKNIDYIHCCIASQTGPNLLPEDLGAAGWPLTCPPYLLETSLPGVFAVGDVRGGSIKHVASAVGEGSIAISFTHKLLQE